MKHTLLISALNQFLNRQPQVTSLLANHAGKTVLFSVADKPLSLQFYIAQNGLLVADDQSSADVTFTHHGQWPGFPIQIDRLIGQMEISGNVELADALSKAFQRVEFNASDWLPAGMGDVLGQRVSQVAQSVPSLIAGALPRIQATLSVLPQPKAPAFLHEQLNELVWLGDKLKDKLTRR